MIQDLLFSITGTGGDRNAMVAAIALASTYDAHLSAVIPVNLPFSIPGPSNITPGMRLSEVCANIREEAGQQAAELRSRLDQESISWEVRIDEAGSSDPPHGMAIQARYADLSVVTAPKHGADDAAVARAFFNALLFESGRPVMVVPTGYLSEAPLRHVVIAWKPTPGASRALHDSLMLLGGTTSVDVVIVDPVVGDIVPGPVGADIATHLSRHGLRVTEVNLPRTGASVATTLLRHAAESNAQLLIAGGYGHSRLREWVMGGTTRELLDALHLPILFSH